MLTSLAIIVDTVCPVHMDILSRTAEVSGEVCEQCGHVELHAKSHHALCNWLSKRI
jgi:hypothetical protein